MDPARGVFRPVKGQEACEYHEPGTPTSLDPSLFPNLKVSLDVPIRGAQFAADRIAPTRSDLLKSRDSNRNPKFSSIRCEVFTIF